MKNLLLATITAIAVSSCTWVQLTAEGENVSLASFDLVRNCEHIGRATSKTLGSIVTVERGGAKLQKELLTLARNEAGRMGGNTVVPESLIDGGEQTFSVYRCPR